MHVRYPFYYMPAAGSPITSEIINTCICIVSLIVCGVAKLILIHTELLKTNLIYTVTLHSVSGADRVHAQVHFIIVYRELRYIGIIH